jgi:hypothetical protein
MNQPITNPHNEEPLEPEVSRPSGGQRCVGSPLAEIRVSGSDRGAAVDAVDVPLVCAYRWRKSQKGYAISVGRKSVRMHRLITGCVANMQVDHINGDRLDNRRSNLRIVTNSQNQMNRRVTNNKCGIKGVYYHIRCKKWCAKIQRDGQQLYLGVFRTAEEAAQARTLTEKQIHGEFAVGDSMRMSPTDGQLRQAGRNQVNTYQVITGGAK